MQPLRINLINGRSDTKLKALLYAARRIMSPPTALVLHVRQKTHRLPGRTRSPIPALTVE